MCVFVCVCVSVCVCVCVMLPLSLSHTVQVELKSDILCSLAAEVNVRMHHLNTKKCTTVKFHVYPIPRKIPCVYIYISLL